METPTFKDADDVFADFHVPPGHVGIVTYVIGEKTASGIIKGASTTTQEQEKLLEDGVLLLLCSDETSKERGFAPGDYVYPNAYASAPLNIIQRGDLEVRVLPAFDISLYRTV